MDRDTALHILHDHQNGLGSYGVRHLSMLGGVTTNETHPDGCVDVLVEFDHTVGVYVYVDLKNYLEDLLGCQVDIGATRCLLPQVKKELLEEATPVT
jgi:predicted nucleotidyltransferase